MKILITGARGGMGKDAAFALATRGHDVIATTRTKIQAKELAKEAKEAELQNLTTDKIDILEAEDRERAANYEPDILINNAATHASGPIAEVPMEYVREVFETNVFSTLALTQLVAQQMVRRGSGRIITFSSVGGRITLPYLGPYNMTKHALESMNDALRQELRPHGIHVSLIEPGAIATGFNEAMNASKYKWFNEDSQFYQDKDRIEAHENMLVADQVGPEVVTKAVIHAALSDKPKTRYIRPRSTGFLVWLAEVLPDWVGDWMVRSRLKT